MKKKLHILLGVILFFTVLVGCLVVGPAENISIDQTSERIERGRYLANHVAVCIDCHSTRNWKYFSGPIVPGTEGQGGEAFTEETGMPGVIFSKNITPAGIGHWSDGEIVRAITSGVNRNNEAFFPIMPYPAYRTMATEDVYSIVTYLKTLKPIPNQVPRTNLNFPMNFIVNTIPQNALPQPLPNPSDQVAYGKYLATIAGCESCHTPSEKGSKLEGMEFAGGFKFSFKGGVVASANITPDVETGIGSWKKEDFIQAFKKYRIFKEQRKSVKPKEFNTVMPWTMFAGMTEADLEALYKFLASLQPIKHRVIKFTPVP